MFQHCRQSCLLFVPIVLVSLFGAGCDQLNSVNGSFEESMESGRLRYPAAGVETLRFFRFHLRQFDDAVGGTFETFDMSSYEMFTTVPEFMNNPVSFYYCARIDYGYVRNNQANIVFTDREQRQWMFQTTLGEENLAGSIRRMDYSDLSGYGRAKVDSLLPEDAAYFNAEAVTEEQIVLQPMRKDSDKSLECLYYFKTTTLKFQLAESPYMDYCQPSLSQCRSLKLAIIGMFPLKNKMVDTSLFQEVTTVYLDDYDLGPDRIRTVQLRDNPFVTQHASPNSIFIATAIVYEDLDLNGVWDKSTEPVWAALNNQALLFYSSSPETTIYGRSNSLEQFEEPTILAHEWPEEPGWHVFSYDTDNSTSESYVAIRKMAPDNASVIPLRPVDIIEDWPRECYLRPTFDGQSRCSGIFPVLFQ